MATLITPTHAYRQRVQALLKQQAQQAASSNDIETQLIFDTEGDHYQLVNIDWQKHRRIYGCIAHMSASTASEHSVMNTILDGLRCDNDRGYCAMRGLTDCSNSIVQAKLGIGYPTFLL